MSAIIECVRPSLSPSARSRYTQTGMPKTVSLNCHHKKFLYRDVVSTHSHVTSHVRGNGRSRFISMCSSSSRSQRNATERDYSLQQRQGHRWVPGLRWDSTYPHVDWTRFHLQILFVDESHKFRSRIAEGLLTRIADWNGYGRALYPESRGFRAEQNAHLELGDASILLGECSRLKLPTYVMKAARECFAREELEHYDLILAMDEVSLEAILATVEEDEREYYESKVMLLSRFGDYITDEQALAYKGAFGLLEKRLRESLEPDMEQLRITQTSSVSPKMAPCSQEGVGAQREREGWLLSINSIILSCAGLVQFLMDANPDDLPEQWLDY